MVDVMPKPVVLTMPITDQHVCESCGSSEYHVNIYFDRTGDWWFDDISVWCDECQCECDLVLESEREEEDDGEG